LNACFFGTESGVGACFFAPLRFLRKLLFF